ncbi:MAG: glycoside hydrolase family protein [Lachnospiraceae bacterium]|nr:glycoside hydrolase family protein [Lachnospiraceae bacterium]
MKTSSKGINLIKEFEGCHLKAYKCPAGVWTIGYGHTAGVKEGQVITQEKALQFLKSDLKKYEKHVESFRKKYNWNQNQFDAMVSFAFNVGSINQLTANGTRTIQQISNKILLYNKAGVVVLAGLTRRRKAEQKLFLAFIPTVPKPTLKMGSIKKTEVKNLQECLNHLGFTDTDGKSLVADGDFGVKTKQAVNKFKKKYGLPTGGTYGTKAYKKMLSLIHPYQ